MSERSGPTSLGWSACGTAAPALCHDADVTPTESTDWRAEKRATIEAVFATARRGPSERHLSPSGRYELEVVPCEPRASDWRFAEGVVRRTGRPGALAHIRRNYAAFPFAWCEGHANGHDYLIAGEDYQGQTIVELDSGLRVDHLADGAQQGVEFCWARHHVAPMGDVLIVDGCFWGCPYELVAFDFSQPLRLPYAQLYRWSGELDVVDGFDEHGWLTWTFGRTVRRRDAMPLDELSDEDERELLDDEGRYVAEALEFRSFRARWRAGTPFESTDTEVVWG